MCGISGYWGDFSSEIPALMTAAIAHRGPDDRGIWTDNEHRVGLVHTRLAIIDLSPAGHQPMIDADGPAVVTYNGEIYNYRELRKELSEEGYGFQSNSDTEVLLKLYHRDGTKMVSSLNGIFAFAIWDRRRQILFLARDGLGVKPLYYAVTRKGFLFASELKAILVDPSVPKDLDFAALQCYLTYLWCPAPMTPLRSVRKLEPGQAMVVRDRKIENKWYHYEQPYTGEKVPIGTRDSIAEGFQRIRTAVERQLVADVPVGAFLSGGLDSSSIVAMAQMALNGKSIDCFTIDAGAQGEGFADDLPYARRVAAKLGVELHVIKPDPAILNKLPLMIYHLDEPQADPAPLHVMQISRLARDHGIKVLLSGAGGDDIFTGYRRHRALLLERWWSWLPIAFRSGLKGSFDRLPKDNPTGRRLAKAFRYAELSGEDRLISYFYWIDPAIAKNLFNHDVRSALNGCDPGEPLRRSLKHLPEGIEPLDKMLYLEARHFLADHNLSYTDKMSMAVGVEVRVPLLDIDLVAYAASLPVHSKQHGREGKWILKKCMEGILPREVIYRPKSGFGAPLRKWLHGDLAQLVDRMLSRESIVNRGIFDPLAVRQLIAEDRASRIDAAYTIFSLICLEIWCRIFLDGQHYDKIEI